MAACFYPRRFALHVVPVYSLTHNIHFPSFPGPIVTV